MGTPGEIAVDYGLGLTSEDEDGRLWRSAAAGDQRAFELIVERHSARVTSVAAHFLEDREDVADAVQETFIRAWEGRRRYRGDAGVRAWLLSITVNVCRNRRRGYWRWRLFLKQDAAGMCGSPEDPRATAEGRLGRRELEQAIRELPDVLRVPFTLRFLEELSGAEIAQILGCTESTVWTRIYKARADLRRKLAAQGLPDGL